jgi:hydrogenase maturation protease
MNHSQVDKVVEAVLYEGYVLYPYRPSVKTQQRWTFGGIYPPAFAEAQGGSDIARNQTQCVAVAGGEALLEVTVRFLHLMDRTVAAAGGGDGGAAGADAVFQPVQSLRVGVQRYHPWQEAMERVVAVEPMRLERLVRESYQLSFSFPGSRHVEELPDAAGRMAGRLMREQHAIEGTVEVHAQRHGEQHWLVTVRVANETLMGGDSPPGRDEALLRTFNSAHVILRLPAGRFISLTDPPEALRGMAEACCNIGCWPVLVGEAGQADTMLCSPIILYDYPQVAPQSPGNLFDGTEIDEILTLRIMTLTDEEKQQAAAVDERVRALLARTESLAREQLMTLHGTVHALQPVHSEEHHA